MTNVMTLNNVGFMELTRDEMLAVDGGIEFWNAVSNVFVGTCGAIGGGLAGAGAGSLVGTVTLPVIGTVSGAVIGAVGGAITGFAVGVKAGDDFYHSWN